MAIKEPPAHVITTRACRPARSAWSATSSSDSHPSRRPTASPPRWVSWCSRSARSRRRCSCSPSSRCCWSPSPTRNCPGHTGLRHHVHVGHQGVRAVDRVDRRLGPCRLGDHRAGQRRRDRRDLPVSSSSASTRWPRIADRQGAARLLLHHRDDADQCARHRGFRADPERVDRHPVRRADHRQHHRARPRVQPAPPGTRRSRRSCAGCGPAGWTCPRSPPPSSCASSSTGAGTPAWRSARRPRTPDKTPGSRAVITTLILVSPTCWLPTRCNRSPASARWASA